MPKSPRPYAFGGSEGIEIMQILTLLWLQVWEKQKVQRGMRILKFRGPSVYGDLKLQRGYVSTKTVGGQV